jgi:hypothetical protein
VQEWEAASAPPEWNAAECRWLHRTQLLEEGRACSDRGVWTVSRAEIEYLARCHCGVLSARYQTALEPAAWPMRACQCSFCRSHGALMTSDPAGLLEFRTGETNKVRRYRFGGRTADFLICQECGVYVGVQMVTDAGRFGVVNVLTFRPLLADLPVAQSMDFGAETAEVRRVRRVSRWTPVSAESL